MSNSKEFSIRERDCVRCKAVCCKHVALQIDKPTCKQDYDNIRWYLMHENIRVFIDDNNDYYIEFKTDCKNLTKDYKCGDYENRPEICRKYPSKNEFCEYESDEDSFKVEFRDVFEYENYLNEKGIDWKFKRHIK